ncbi:MAG: hypothetical protein QM296_07035 [Bacillota bacterium]|nr:hypothetical protein [Bacillota bacterium]
MKRNTVLVLLCTVFLLTLVLIPDTSVQAAGVTLYDTASYCNVPAANPGDPSYSEMTERQRTYGFGCEHERGRMLAETFILNNEATIQSVELFAYQQRSGTTPTITGVYLKIYDGNPAEGANAIWGDWGTNVFNSAGFTGCYRVQYGYRDHDRPIMKIVADISPGLRLAAGTYWLAFSLDGSLSNGPWGTPNILDTPDTAGTAIQWANGYWNIARDSRTGVQGSIPLRVLGDTRLPQTAPAAPVVAVLTDTSITLEEITGAEYRLNDGAWQTDPEFTGLSPNTSYNLYARLAETDTHLASPESPATTATTLKSAQTAPAAPVVAVLTDTSITLEEITGAEYRLNDGAWQTDPEFTGLSPNTTYNLYARLAETDTHLASPESPVTTATTLKSAQTAPTAPVVATLTDTSITLEEIAGAEYRLNDGAWQTDPEFTGLSPNTTYKLYVRLAETDTHLASPESPVTTATTLKSDQTEPDKTEPTKTEPTETEATQPEDAIPKTGESSGHDPWLSLLLISVSGLILLTRKKRMSQQRN